MGKIYPLKYGFFAIFDCFASNANFHVRFYIIKINYKLKMHCNILIGKDSNQTALRGELLDYLIYIL